MIPADRAALEGQALSPAAISVARDLAFEALVEHCSLAESYARSASEAAWRGDLTTLGVHIRQLRLCVITAIQTFKSLNDEEGSS
jgi:hypothetical protein